MASDWFGISLSTVGYVVLSVIGMYVAVLILVRLAGLRSFAEMTSFDFAMTIAVGTIIGTTGISGSISLPVGALALATMFAIQFLIAFARVHGGSLGEAFDNKPRLVMAQGEVLDGPLEESRLTREDLFAKLREANVRNFEEVLAVVLETTGDVSVIHTEGGDVDFDLDLLQGVEGVEQAFATSS